MFHLVLRVTVKDAEQHNRAYNEMGAVLDLLAGEVPSVNLSSYDMTCTLPDTEELYLDENTMFKVLDAVKAALPMSCVMKGEEDKHALDIIFAIQNAGILFREPQRASSTEEGTGSSAAREDDDPVQRTSNLIRENSSE